MSSPILPPSGESGPAPSSVVAPENLEGVASAVENALHQTFGVDAGVETHQNPDHPDQVHYEFTVAGKSYTLDLLDV